MARHHYPVHTTASRLRQNGTGGGSGGSFSQPARSYTDGSHDARCQRGFTAAGRRSGDEVRYVLPRRTLGHVHREERRMSMDFDVIVIGSGFGGAITACRLAEANYKVLILERGRRWDKTSYPRTPSDMWTWNN